MFKTKVLFLLLFSSFILFSQNKKVPNYKDSVALYLSSYNKKKDFNILEKTLLFANQSKNDSLIKKINLIYGLKGYLKKDFKALTISIQNLKNSFKKTEDSLTLASYYHYKALTFALKFKSDSSIYYYNASKDVALKMKDSLSAGRRLLGMGIILYNERDYKGSEYVLVKGLKILESIKHLQYTSYSYNWLGHVMQITDRQEEARESYLMAHNLKFKYVPKRLMPPEIARYYSNIAKTFESEGDNVKAKKYFKKCLDIDSLSFKNIGRYDIVLEGYSYNNFMLGNKKEALEGYLKVFKSRKKRKVITALVYSYSLLGELYASNNEKKKAIFYTKKAIEISKKVGNAERILENLLLLSKLVKGEKGRQYLEEHFKLNDSLFKRERSFKNQFAKIRYETEKKDKENADLKSENDKKQLQLESEKQQKTIGWLVAGASILFIGFGASMVSNRRKKLLFDAKLQQVEAREKERQQIAKSLHDEVAGDIRMLHLKFTNTNQIDEANKLNVIKENVRNLSHQLSSVSFNEVSFKNQIINLVSDYFEADFQIKIKEINSVKWKEINNSFKRTLFLSIRESLQNINKYAEAKIVTLSFKETKKSIYLTISDNGKGFNVDEKKKGIGLRNMKERISEINGVFSIKSTLEKGTTIEIEIPKNGR